MRRTLVVVFRSGFVSSPFPLFFSSFPPYTRDALSQKGCMESGQTNEASNKWYTPHPPFAPPSPCSHEQVAGGLGERLGYDGIKLALPVEVSSKCVVSFFFFLLFFLVTLPSSPLPQDRESAGPRTRPTHIPAEMYMPCPWYGYR